MLLKPFIEDSQRWIHIREFARELKISPASAKKKLEELKKENLLDRKEERGFVLYKANEKNENFKNIKIFENVKKINESKLVSEISDEYMPDAIILFGSTSKGLDRKDSDIDIAIITSNKQSHTKENLKKFEQILKKKIQTFVMSAKELKEHKELANNILNGKILSGYIEVF